MSCPCTGEFANVYLTINNLEGNFNAITGNTLSNYNQLSRIVSQQANIYNTLYYGTGNMSTGFLSVGANCNISGNLILNNGNVGIRTSNPQSSLSVNGNAVITGNLNISGNIFSNGISTFSSQLGFQIQMGSVTIETINSTNSVSVIINFSPTFRTIPTVIATAEDGTLVSWILCRVGNKSTTSAQLTARNLNTTTNATNITVNWIAMG